MLEAPIEVLEPLQIVLFPPVLFVGNGLTVTTAEFVAEQPVAVIVSVKLYVVVDAGEAVGFETVELLKPVEGDQL